MPLFPKGVLKRTVKPVSDIPKSLKDSPDAQRHLAIRLREEARAADWERRYQKKLKQVQNKDLSKKIARARAIKKNRGR
jgi:Xaa-Pro aminopeptidase